MKMMMIFSIQMILLFTMLWATAIGPYMDGSLHDLLKYEQYPFGLLAIKLLCS